jgi:hypothetical protein
MTMCIAFDSTFDIVGAMGRLLIGRLTSWSYQRQLLCRSGLAPLEALRAVVAVYSTHPTAPMSLLARCQRLTPTDFLALEERREAIRLPAMRSSGFLMPTDSAARIFSATRQPQQRLARRLQYGGLDFETYQRLARWS